MIQDLTRAQLSYILEETKKHVLTCPPNIRFWVERLLSIKELEVLLADADEIDSQVDLEAILALLQHESPKKLLKFNEI